MVCTDLDIFFYPPEIPFYVFFCLYLMFLGVQNEPLREALQAAERRLRALDVEDQDAEREQLALVEHILEKLSAEVGHDEDQLPEAPATQPASGTPAGAPEAREARKTAELKPVAMLGPP